MSQNLALRAAKLSTETIKTKNSKNVSLAFEHHPKDPAERKHGVLFAVIGIGGDVKKAEDLTEIILETFHGEYYQDLSKSSLASFEDSLSKINEELAEYTNDGNTYWMGKLNAVLAVQSENTLHLTQAGKAEAYMIRSDKVTHISKGLAGEDINPLRTFINVASGEVIEGDKVALISPGILAACSPEDIKGYVSEYHPKVAVNNIAEVVDNLGNKEAQNSAVVIEYLSPQALANETLDNEPEEIWLESATKKDVVMDRAMDAFEKSSSSLASLTNGVGSLLKKDKIEPEKLEELVPEEEPEKPEKEEEEAEEIREIPKEEVKKPPVDFEREDILLETDEEIRFDEEKQGKFNFQNAQKEALREELEARNNKSEIRIRESEESPKKAKIVETKDAILNNIGSFYGSARKLNPIKTSRRIRSGKINRKQMIIGGFVLAVAFSGALWFVSSQRLEASNRQKERAKIEEVNNMFDEATTEKNDQRAATLLSDALTALSELHASFYPDDSKALAEKIQAEIMKITKSETKETKVVADLSSVLDENIAGVYQGDANIYFFSQSGRVAKYDRLTKKSTIVQTSGDFEGKIVDVAPLYRIRSAAVLTDTPMVYEFDFDTLTYAKKEASDGWEKANDIDSYGTNLYLLEPGEKDIKKHVRVYGGYGKGQTYFMQTTSFGEPEGFTIDSDIYVIDKEGKISKFIGGIEDSLFSVSNLYFPLKSNNTIYTNEELPDIYVLNKDEKYLAIIGKEGPYKKRYYAELDSPNGIFIEEDTIYILDGKKLKSIDT